MDKNDIVHRQLRYLSTLRAGFGNRQVCDWPTTVAMPYGVAEPKVDSYLLALAAAPYAHGALLDAFAGSGIVGFWLLHRVQSAVFTDISPAAIAFIQTQIDKCPRRGSLSAEQADVYPDSDAVFDTIVANPPYTDRPATSTIESICFDEGNAGLRKLILGLRTRLTVGGRAFVSWPSYCPPKLIESLSAGLGLTVDVCASVREPMSLSDERLIEYRIYKLTRREA